MDSERRIGQQPRPICHKFVLDQEDIRDGEAAGVLEGEGKFLSFTFKIPFFQSVSNSN